MFEIGCDRESCEMAGVKPRTWEVFEARWREIFGDPAVTTRIIEVGVPGPGGGVLAGTAEFAGSISVFQAPGETKNSIGYWISRSHWGQGVASRAVALLLLEETRRPLHATAATRNVASFRVLMKNGFRLVRTCMGEETERYLAREIGEFLLE